MNLLKKEKGNGVTVVKTDNQFALVTSKEILGPFHIKKIPNTYQVSKPTDDLLMDDLKSNLSNKSYGRRKRVL